MLFCKKQPDPKISDKNIDYVPENTLWKWLGLNDPITRYTLALVVVAGVRLTSHGCNWVEIHSGSDDTKALVSANQNQLKAMQAEQQPWVSVNIPGGIAVSKPLQFDPTKGASLGIQYTIRNTGKSPALHVTFRSKLVALPYVKWIQEEFADAQDALCEPLRINHQAIFDLTVFPGDAIEGSEVVGITPENLTKALMAKEFGPFAHKGFVSLAVIACIDYQLPLEGRHHQTRYGFHLGVPLDGVFMADLKPEGTSRLLKNPSRLRR